ncbi:MAG: phenylalanine--tRNA ligase beta subunit-related protein [Ignisphaera sp.]|nr:phenylalanine--tRNA ligase beta subunit-related protein [Ignisphaera sp.]MCX8167480.1 phenylalanine--tRNA ligase beta subunit-related protein [Ignisphaera sp.]MDW8084656.1 phenylalanine--tRNA ligase beta subunit-related protein [Ignisphaera sp.]
MELCSSLETIVTLDECIKDMDIFIAYTLSWKVSDRAGNEGYPFETEMQELVNYIKSHHSLDSLKNDGTIRAYRDFFWKIGVDPTKVRPSSEALIRRALRNSFPRIDPIVDAGNISSAYTMVPIGMYDLERCTPPLTLRLSRGNEIFRPIGGVEEKLREGIPILVDAKNNVMHIYPHRDSIDTAVRSETRRVVIIAAGVSGVDRDRVKKAVDLTMRLLAKIGWSWCGSITVKP